jgi:hypothetical protein
VHISLRFKRIGQRARGLHSIVLVFEERTGAKSHLEVSEKIEWVGILIGSGRTNKAKQPATWVLRRYSRVSSVSIACNINWDWGH